MKQITTIITIAFLCLYNCNNNDKSPLTCQDELDHKCWSKSGSTRRSIELPVSTFSGYELKLKPGFNDSTLHFDLPLSEDDTVKIGRFDIDIYSNIEKAKLDLLDFLYSIQSNVELPRLSKNAFLFGDVAFGKDRECIFFVFFTQDNVRIIIDAQTNIAKELAQKIVNIILNSPVGKTGNPKSSFIITNEFLQAFLAGL